MKMEMEKITKFFVKYLPKNKYKEELVCDIKKQIEYKKFDIDRIMNKTNMYDDNLKHIKRNLEFSKKETIKYIEDNKKHQQLFLDLHIQELSTLQEILKEQI